MDRKNDRLKKIFDKYKISDADRAELTSALTEDSVTEMPEEEICHTFVSETEDEVPYDEKGEVSFYDIFKELHGSLLDACDYCEILKRRLERDRKIVDLDKIELENNRTLTD